MSTRGSLPSMEHRWRDISGPSLGDDPDWRTTRTLPTFGGGSPSELEAGTLTRLSPKRSSLVAWFELYDGQGQAAQPVSPTPVVTATLEVITVSYDAAGNTVYSVGEPVVAATNQRRLIEVEAIQQGVSFIRISSIAGATTDPGSLRIFVDDEVRA